MGLKIFSEIFPLFEESLVLGIKRHLQVASDGGSFCLLKSTQLWYPVGVRSTNLNTDTA